MKNLLKFILPLTVLSLLIYLVIAIATIGKNPEDNTYVYESADSTYQIIIVPVNNNTYDITEDDIRDAAMELMDDAEYYKNKN